MPIIEHVETLDGESLFANKEEELLFIEKAKGVSTLFVIDSNIATMFRC